MIKYANCAVCGLLLKRTKLHRLKSRYSPFYCKSCLGQVKTQMHLERIKELGHMSDYDKWTVLFCAGIVLWDFFVL